MAKSPIVVTHELSVCRCCLLMVANDEGCDCSVDPDQHPHDVACFPHLGTLVSIVADGAELGFCSTECDGCGTHLAGDRFRVVVLSA